MVRLTGPRRSNSVNWKCLLVGDGAPEICPQPAISNRGHLCCVNNVRSIDQRVESVNLPLYGGQVVGGRSQKGSLFFLICRFAFYIL